MADPMSMRPGSRLFGEHGTPELVVTTVDVFIKIYYTVFVNPGSLVGDMDGHRLRKSNDGAFSFFNDPANRLSGQDARLGC